MLENYSLLNATPTVPAEVYDALPPFLKAITDLFSDKREKDIVLTSCLVILGGCFTGIKGKYMTDWLSPSLYAFIVAPPASGKGVMKYPQLLGKRIQEEFEKGNAEAKARYEADDKIWKMMSKKQNGDAGDPPVKPKYPILFIPGNSSSASIYKLLMESDGKAIICESEADSLASAIKQEWGNFSHVLRCAFQHEPITMSRSGDNLYLRVERPHLSVLLTGTPDQVPRLIGSAEDGLFSRFMFYCFSQDLVWRDPTPCVGCTDLTLYFEKLSNSVAKIKKQLDSVGYTFSLNEDQFRLLNENFEKKIKSVKLFEGHGAGSAVIRLGPIAFRIAMTLTVLRHMDDLKGKTHLECSDEDFKATMGLIDVYYEHSLVMYSLLPKHSNAGVSPKLRQFYASLPAPVQFSRKRAVEIGETIGISARTVGNYLQKLTDNELLSKSGYGIYQKQEEK